MGERAYSPRRYGRSEHAPIVIDMVDYGNDDFEDEFTYSSGHYSSPRHLNSVQSSPRHLGLGSSGGTGVVGSHHASPHHSMGTRQGSPRRSRQSTPRLGSSSVDASHASPRHTLSSLTLPASPRQAIHMHNFAQRRSFMMGGFDRSEEFHTHPQPPQSPPQEMESNRVYRVEDDEDAPYEDYPVDTPRNDITENEYRQSPGRSRNYRLVDEVDARDRPMPQAANNSLRSRVNISRASAFSKKHHVQLVDDSPIYSSLGASSSRLQARSHMETTSTRHAQGATIPVFNRLKHPEESVFTFDSASHNDVQVMPVPRAHSDGGPLGGGRESVTETPATEKKVFYFDIDDLSQRLLNSGDQDLSRRLRKKKAKNVRSRISRNRARRKSKSVFNLEFDISGTSAVDGNENILVPSPDLLGLSRDGSTGEYSRFDNRSTAGPLYVDTSGDTDDFAANPKSPTRAILSGAATRDESAPLRRTPSAGSPPTEQQPAGTSSPDATMEYDPESMVQEKGKVTPAASPREPPMRDLRQMAKQGSPRHEAHEQPHVRQTPSADKRPSHGRAGEDATPTNKATGAESIVASSPKQANRLSSPSSATNGPDIDAEMSPRKIKATGSSEVRVTKAYDDINDRLDHIVKRENDVETRQKAIRAVFEEVQQHVADLRKYKQLSVKGGAGDKQDRLVDLASSSDSKPKRTVTDEGDDQVFRRMNESSDNEDIFVKVDMAYRRMSIRSPENRTKVLSPTIDDMVSPPIAPFAPPSPVGRIVSAPAQSPPNYPRSETINVSNTTIEVADDKQADDMVREGTNSGSMHSDQDVLVIDLLDNQGDDQKPSNLEPGSANVGSKNHEMLPSGYLSSDNSGDDEVVVQKQSPEVVNPEGSNDVVYVIEEDDGKSVVHVAEKATIEPEPDSKMLATRIERKDPIHAEVEIQETSISSDSRGIDHSRVEAPCLDTQLIKIRRVDAPHIETPSHGLHGDLKTAESRGNEILNCVEDEDMDQTDHEDRLEPDGSRIETKDSSPSDRAGLVVLASQDDNRALPASTSKISSTSKLVEVVPDESESEDAVGVDIDKEFESVVPVNNDDTPVNFSIRIEETLDRVARQNKLIQQEMQQTSKITAEQKKVLSPRQEKQKESTVRRSPAATPLSRRDEEEKVNALMDSLSNGSLFSCATGPPQLRHPQSNQMSVNQKVAEMGSNFKESQADEEEEEDDDVSGKGGIMKRQITEKAVVSLEYDFNLAISAASKSSSSTSDLQEFPMAADQHGDYASASSNVSSDISESTSGSVTESSYDSFISIVETEDESDLEFFDEQEGFAENFMSNLVSSTFGWIEKKQEQLVCGFKSGEFDGPSLLRQSMTRQKKGEPDEKSRSNKTMKSLRQAVASSYAKATPASASDKKQKSSNAKKTTGRSETAIGIVEERLKRGKKKSDTPSRKSPLRAHLESANNEEPTPKGTERSKKKSAAYEKPERINHHMEDSRKKSLVDDRMKSDSDRSGQGKIKSAGNDREKGSPKRTPSVNEAPAGTTRITGTSRATSSSRNSETKDSPTKASRHPSKPSAKAAASNTEEYTFDLISSEEGENPSVQVIDPPKTSVLAARLAEKETRKSNKTTKKVDTQDERRQKKLVFTNNTKPMEAEKATPKGQSVTLSKSLDSHNVAVQNDLLTERIKAKSKRPKHGIQVVSMSPSPPLSRNPQDEALSPSTQDARAPPSPPKTRTRSASPRTRKPPSTSSGLQHDRDAFAGSVVERVSKRTSGNKIPSTKHSVATSRRSSTSSKNEKASSAKDSSSKATEISTGSKLSSARGSRKLKTGRGASQADERGTDESESEDDESDTNLTEEEREKARKDRRRVAALKRRRKLRERRRVKLEQNLTDDTFG